MSRKVTTTHLQVKSVKNAKVLGTDKDGFVIERDLDFLNHIPKDGAIDVQAGTNITIDKTNPLKPVINAGGGSSGGGNIEIQGGNNVYVNNFNPLKPVITVNDVNGNLSYKPLNNRGVIESSIGTDAHIPLSDKGVVGLMQYCKGSVIGTIKYLVIESEPYPPRDSKPDDIILNESKEEIKVNYRIVNDMLYLFCRFSHRFKQTKYFRYRAEINLNLPITTRYETCSSVNISRQVLTNFLNPASKNKDELTFSDQRAYYYENKAEIQFEIEGNYNSNGGTAGRNLFHVYATFLDPGSNHQQYQKINTVQ